MRSVVGTICFGSRFACLLLLAFFLLDDRETLDFDEAEEVVDVVVGLYFAVCNPACVFDSVRLLVTVMCFAVGRLCFELALDVAL